MIIACVVEKEKYTYYVTTAFILGALTSIASGYIGMWISVRTNVRVSKMANSSLHDAFVVAFRGGSVLGFFLVGLGLLNLVFIIIIYKKLFLNLNVSVKGRGFKEMFEVIAGYGLGGSAVALFGRVGGGIYTKAADVGADLNKISMGSKYEFKADTNPGPGYYEPSNADEIVKSKSQIAKIMKSSSKSKSPETFPAPG